MAINWKSSESFPPPQIYCILPLYKLSVNPIFEWSIFVIISVNVLCNIVELVIIGTVALIVLRWLNVTFCTIYIAEAIVKVQLKHINNY